MKTRARIVVSGVFLVLIGAWASAQVRQVTPVDPPVVVSGNDIGFRIEGRQGGTQVGRLVVRVDGKWVEAQLGGGVPMKVTLR